MFKRVYQWQSVTVRLCLVSIFLASDTDLWAMTLRALISDPDLAPSSISHTMPLKVLGCIFLIKCLTRESLQLWCSLTVHARSLQSYSTLCDPIDWSPPGFSVYGTPGENTGVGCHALLQGIFNTQGLNLWLLHCRQILYHWDTMEALPHSKSDSKLRRSWLEDRTIVSNILRISIWQNQGAVSRKGQRVMRQ